MGIKRITDEKEFWALLELGVPIYTVGEGGRVEACSIEGCVEERYDRQSDWLRDFRERWLPSGEYYVMTE